MTATKPLALLLLLVSLAVGVWALFAPDPKSDLRLSNATAAPIEGRPGEVGVFLKIDNAGGADRLIGARSPAATSATLDAPTDWLAIPANSQPVLAPDGAFLRLSGVTGSLEDGQIIPVSLDFEQAGTQVIQARLVAPRQEGDAPLLGLFGIGGICRVGEGEPAPQLSLSAEPDAEGWRIAIATTDFEFSQDLADGPHVPGTGHGHLYLNGMKLQRLYNAEAWIGPLPSGRHEVRVTLNTNDHRSYVVGDIPVTASVVIEVP